MRILFLLLLFLNAAWFPLMGQENPKTDVNQILGDVSEADLEYYLDRLNQGERYYRSGYYEGSYRAFYELYKQNPEVASLNYKLGVSALLGDKQEEAAGFLLESLPSVAEDYYLLLGYAHRARMEYSRAREAFEQYNNTLSSWSQKQFRPLLNQLLSDCEFGGANATDSVPAFVLNPGPAVNSYYDEYAAVEDGKNERIFFVTRRPDYLPDVPVGRDVFEERILEASYVDGVVSEGVENGKLNSRFNSGVAGISPDGETLYVYRGKKRGGQIGLSDISGKRARKPKPISERVDHKVFKETSFTETEDGVVFFVSDRRDGIGGKDIWTCRRKGSRRFSKPRNMGPVINTEFNEEGVYVTPDGNILYFSSEGHPGFGGFDIYRVERNRDGEWMHPVNMGQPFNSPFDDLFFFPASDSLVSLIASSRPGGYGGLDLYKVRKDIRVPFSVAGTISDAESGQGLYAQVALIDTIKREQVLTSWTDSLTGDYLVALEDTGNYVLQAGAEGYKMALADVPKATRRDAAFTIDFRLEKLKHPYALNGVITDVDTQQPVQAEITFRPLDKDSVTHRIFSDKETGAFEITFEDKFDLRMIVSAKDYHLYSSELLLKNTLGDSEEKNIELEKSVIAYTLSGKVMEEKTNDAVPAELAVFEPGEENAFLVAFADSTTGKYSLTVYEDGPYLVEVNADGYFFNNFPLQFHPDTTLKINNIGLKPMARGARIVAENILFTSGKATLRAESYPELNRLARLLSENPSVKIEVSGHTDNTGSASLNKRLSKSRALSVKRYLEGQGIAPERIDYEGYGFDQPIAPNITPEGRALNRRVEIKVIE
ncbi:OmpA family protein [Marinilabilia salmonicolor]|uniref:WD40 repeat protein n=1 Tax=Marinilabilia salmonicolor TaxID=989 RepID=A0A368UVG5_9BACT|nr:OmpA family protein [Marinilabilia salmonicolor]RCW32040.1 WD40 repeat protein [Marinilabilia salmonicolor]